MIDRSGIIKLSKQIDGRCTDFIKSINQNNASSSHNLASQILYDCQILKSMIMQHPQWLIQLIEQCQVLPKKTGKDYLTTVAEIVGLMFEAKSFDWNTMFEDSNGTIEYDKLFDTYKAQSKLDDALGQLIKCLELVLNEPTFNLNKKTREDIKTVINSVRANRNSSDSAIRSALASFYGLIKTVVPGIETCEKWVEFSGKLQDAYVAILNELTEIRLKIQVHVKQEFMNDNFSLPELGDLTPDAPLVQEVEQKKIESLKRKIIINKQ